MLCKTYLWFKWYYEYINALTAYLFARKLKPLDGRKFDEYSIDHLKTSVNPNRLLDYESREYLFLTCRKIFKHELKILSNHYVDVSIQNGSKKVKNKLIRYNNPNYRPIDWHCDISSGYHWKKLSCPQLLQRRLPPKAGVDIKLPWELSRAQHLYHLALCYKLVKSKTENTITARDIKESDLYNEFCDQVADWISSNPTKLGVNWMTEMDISMRVVSWLLTFLLFEIEFDQNDSWQSLFSGSIREHVNFLYKKTKHPFRQKGNHYAAQIAGLYICSKIFPFISNRDHINDLAKNRLEQQIQVQVRCDGSHFEESSSYHLLMTEIFLFTGIIADCLKDPFSMEYRERVHKMLNVIKTVSSSRYEVPQIGDNDEGYFLKAINVNLDKTHTRAGHLLELGEFYLNGKYDWTLNEALLRMLIVKKQNIPNKPSMCSGFTCTTYRDCGWMVMEQGLFKTVLCLGPSCKRARMGHSHDDILSFSLFWNGYPIIVDPGTYVYTPYPKMRNHFRYSISHNQPQFERPQEEWTNKKVFSHISIPRVYSKMFTEGKKQNSVYAEAYYKHDSVMYHTSRGIILNNSNDRIQIEDSISSKTPGKARIAICLHPDVKCKQTNTYSFRLQTHGAELVFESDSKMFVPQKGRYSKSYGHICDTTWLVYKRDTECCLVNWSITNPTDVKKMVMLRDSIQKLSLFK